MKQNYKFTISYDGRRYHGWESKKDVDTIEGKIEAVLSKMTGEAVKINGAGRTDAGVHASGMVASGTLNTDMSPKQIKAYANHYLPDDICILEAAVVSGRFHARYHAIGKEYRYTCYTGAEKPVFDRGYTWVLPQQITGTQGESMPDLAAMRRAADILTGTHDFKSFCGNNKMKKSTVRTIHSIEISYDSGYLTMIFCGDGFLQNMVRILTGTLLEVGYGKKQPQEMGAILSACDRQKAGPTAPPHGLMLMKVWYPE